MDDINLEKEKIKLDIIGAEASMLSLELLMHPERREQLLPAYEEIRKQYLAIRKNFDEGLKKK